MITPLRMGVIPMHSHREARCGTLTRTPNPALMRTRALLLRTLPAVVALLPSVALAQEEDAPKDVTLWRAFGDFNETMRVKMPLFMIAGVILILSFIIAKFASVMAERALRKSTVHRTAFTIFSKTVYVGALVIGLTIALRVAGLDISFIVGAATFGLGFAMQDLIENYISGVIIVLQEPFHIGDMVEVAGSLGWVEEIEARVTFVKSIDGQRVIIPNSQMISSALVNYSSFTQRRLAVQVGVSYDASIPEVLETITRVLSEDSEILKTPAPLVILKEFGDSALLFEARFWIDQTVSHWMRAPSKMLVKIKRALDEAGVNIPRPILTLNVNEHDSGDLPALLSTKQ